MTSIFKGFNPIDWEELLLLLSTKLIACALILLTSWVIRRLIRLLVKAFSGKTPLFTAQDIARQQTLVKLALNLTDYALFFVTGYCLLATIGVPVSSLLAGAGIAGLAIGLGAQGFLTDLINGAFILIERQYDVGDVVVIQGLTGKVSNLGIRTTQLKSADGTLHIIPNRNITYVSNQSRGNRRVQIDLPLPLGTDFGRVTSLLSAVTTEQLPHHPQILEAPKFLGPRKALDSSTVYRVDILVENGHQETTYYAFYKLFQQTLQKAGILKTN